MLRESCLNTELDQFDSCWFGLVCMRGSRMVYKLVYIRDFRIVSMRGSRMV